MQSALYAGTKRALDVVLSLAALVILAPLLAVIALRVRSDGGRALYQATRIGRYGVPFKMLKFRSMVLNAERMGPSSTADDDPRITRVGAVLRRYKLDELPQLINVLKGDMSIVGPRPQVAGAVEIYTPDERRVLEVRPGMTDYASLHFPNEGEILRGSTDPDRDYMEMIHPHKMRLSRQYIDERSLWGDIRIIALTASRIVFNPNQGSHAHIPN
jgi:lipopolysaccharide/colanic/teichoic acid biosynthesis glycosyltransferase